MEDNVMETDVILNLIKKYKFQIEKQDNERLILRLPFSSKEEVEDFRREFSSKTSTEWNVYNDSSKRTKCFHKVWICHLSSSKKISSSKRNAECRAKLDIKIKSMSYESVARDSYLRQDPPLRTVVTILLKHTHTIHSAATLKLLRVPNELKVKFFKYFDRGVLPAEAASLHESELLCLQQYGDMDNSSKNPTHRQVYYLYDQWKMNNYSPCHNTLEKLKEEIEEPEENLSIVSENVPGEYEENLSIISEDVPGEYEENVSIVSEDVPGEYEENFNVINEEKSFESIKKELLQEWDRIRVLITQITSRDVINHLLYTFKQIKTVDDLEKLTVLRSLQTKKPSSVSWQKRGLTRSQKRVPAGHPSIEVKKEKRS